MTAVPDAIKWCYQDKNFNAGVPQEPDNSVFDALVSPPSSGVAAVAASVADAVEIGTTARDSDNSIKGTYAHVDKVKEFYDGASVLHES